MHYVEFLHNVFVLGVQNQALLELILHLLEEHSSHKRHVFFLYDHLFLQAPSNSTARYLAFTNVSVGIGITIRIAVRIGINTTISPMWSLFFCHPLAGLTIGCNCFNVARSI